MVKCACMKYVQPEVLLDVSEAVHRMFIADIEPRLDAKVFAEPNDFRSSACYNEECDTVLRKYESSLRLVFERTCKLRGQSAAKGIANKLVNFETWKDFCRLYELVDVDVTDRDVTLAFVWSRMKVIDEQKDKSRVLLTHLSFEDWLEALCRLAVRKAFPTSADLAKGGEGGETMGEYVRRLRVQDDYHELLKARCRPWGVAPPEPPHRCVEHLCSLLVATCQRGKGDGIEVTKKEALAFIKLSVRD